MEKEEPLSPLSGIKAYDHFRNLMKMVSLGIGAQRFMKDYLHIQASQVTS